MPRWPKKEQGGTLTVEERDGLREEIDERKAMVGASESFGESNYAHAIPEEVQVNKEKMRAEVKKLQTILDRETPERVSDSGKRQQLVSKRKALQERFIDYLETEQDLGAIRMDSPEYKAAFRKAQKRHEVEGHIQEWKRLGALLEPEDPETINLDQFRKPR